MLFSPFSLLSLLLAVLHWYPISILQNIAYITKHHHQTHTESLFQDGSVIQQACGLETIDEGARR